jgi:hypothetical protein
MLVTEPSTRRLAHELPESAAHDPANRLAVALALPVFLKQYPDMRSFTAGEHCRFNVTFQGRPGNRYRRRYVHEMRSLAR